MNMLDTYRAAKLLVDRHGEDAKAQAMQRVVAMQAASDEAGEMAWMGVFDAVLELQSTRPTDGVVH